MTKKQIVLSILIGGLVATILDVLVHGFLLGNAFYVQQTALFGTESSPLSLTLGDFVSVAVFVWVYQRVRSCFRGRSRRRSDLRSLRRRAHRFPDPPVSERRDSRLRLHARLGLDAPRDRVVCHGGRGRRQDRGRADARHGDGLSGRCATCALRRTPQTCAGREWLAGATQPFSDSTWKAVSICRRENCFLLSFHR